jgi:hypothetical protein
MFLAIDARVAFFFAGAVFSLFSLPSILANLIHEFTI